MLEYLVESWHYTDPQRKERSECENWESALGLARALAAEGEDVAVYRLEHSFMGEEIDPCTYNGVTPGRDFPATTSRTAA